MKGVGIKISPFLKAILYLSPGIVLQASLRFQYRSRLIGLLELMEPILMSPVRSPRSGRIEGRQADKEDRFTV